MKSYFAFGIIVALSWVGLAAGAHAQDRVSGPSLLPLPEAQREYPTTPYPNAPVGAYETGTSAWSNSRGPVFGQRFANNNPGVAPLDGPHATPEAVPTPAAPNGIYPDASPSPSDKHHDPYADAMSSPYGSGVTGAEGASGFDAGDMCGYGGGAVSGIRGGGGWWGSVGGLIMGRDRGNGYRFSYFDSNEAGQYTTQQYNWGGGVQASVGHCFMHGCNTYGIEAVYWGLYPGVNEQTTLAGQQPGNLNAILNFNQLNYNGGLASLSANNAAAHRLRSSYEIQNVELNLLNFTYAGTGDCGASRHSYSFGAGFRWFRFIDGLQFASDPANNVFNGAPEEIYYDIRTINDLVGFQLMGQCNYWITNKLGASFGTKFGIYDNFMSHTSRIGGAAGDAVVNNGPFNGAAWNIAGNSSTVALLGQVDAGLTYSMTSHWSLFAGYRVMGVSNVALTTNQIFPDLRGINDVAAINHNGSLILHGAYAGAQFCW